MIGQCLERKDLRTADYYMEALKHITDFTEQEETKKKNLTFEFECGQLGEQWFNAF